LTDDLKVHGAVSESMAPRSSSRITPQFSGRTLPFDARRERIMKWSARDDAAMPYHGPLQLLVRRLARRQVNYSLGHRSPSGK